MKCSSRSVGCRNWLKVKDQVQTGRDDKVDAESDVTCDNDDDVSPTVPSHFRLFASPPSALSSRPIVLQNNHSMFLEVRHKIVWHL